jgi:hypothetical protein
MARPVYISVTSIFQNQDILLKTLRSIAAQSQLPDRVFIYLCEQPYILDKGFSNKIITNTGLLEYINNPLFSLIWTENIGPYTKLLPILKDKWNEDCLIITLDDDTYYHPDLIKNLVSDYNIHKCVIGYRGFTPKFNILRNINYNKRDILKSNDLYNFTTGKGGVLYHPKMFYRTGNLIFNKSIYQTHLKTTDDIWFYIIRICNNINAYIGTYPFMIDDYSRSGLYRTINSKSDTNTSNLRSIINLLVDLGHLTPPKATMKKYRLF